MKLKDSIRRIVPTRWQRTTRAEPLSMVLLLRKPHPFSAEELQLAAERAWRMSFAGKEDNSKHCVVRARTHSAFSITPNRTLAMTPKKMRNWLSHPSQRQAWINHSAWAGLNDLNHTVRVELGYAALSKLVAEMLEGNCTGGYIPQRSSLLPNDESLYVGLQKWLPFVNLAST
jgi:hypothetical protein